MAKRELRLGAGLNGIPSSAAELRLNRPRPAAARERDWELDLVLLVGPRAAPDARTHCQIGPSPTALELGSHLTRCWRERDSNPRSASAWGPAANSRTAGENPLRGVPACSWGRGRVGIQAPTAVRWVTINRGGARKVW